MVGINEGMDRGKHVDTQLVGMKGCPGTLVQESKVTAEREEEGTQRVWEQVHALAGTCENAAETGDQRLAVSWIRQGRGFPS